MLAVDQQQFPTFASDRPAGWPPSSPAPIHRHHSMTNSFQRLAAALLAGVACSLLLSAQARAGACDDPTDTGPSPRQNCQLPSPDTTPAQFRKMANQEYNSHAPASTMSFSATISNGTASGFDYDNNCFSYWNSTSNSPYTLRTTFYNWCNKPEPLIVSLGCMP